MSGNDSAFPSSLILGPNDAICTSNSFGVGGLTKRELFAAMAMQGLCACNVAVEGKPLKLIASLSVGMADALLAELAKERTDGLLEALKQLKDMLPKDLDRAHDTIEAAIAKATGGGE